MVLSQAREFQQRHMWELDSIHCSCALGNWGDLRVTPIHIEFEDHQMPSSLRAPSIPSFSYSACKL